VRRKVQREGPDNGLEALILKEYTPIYKPLLGSCKRLLRPGNCYLEKI